MHVFYFKEGICCSILTSLFLLLITFVKLELQKSKVKPSLLFELCPTDKVVIFPNVIQYIADMHTE